MRCAYLRCAQTYAKPTTFTLFSNCCFYDFHFEARISLFAAAAAAAAAALSCDCAAPRPQLLVRLLCLASLPSYLATLLPTQAPDPLERMALKALKAMEKAATSPHPLHPHRHRPS